MAARTPLWSGFLNSPFTRSFLRFRAIQNERSHCESCLRLRTRLCERRCSNDHDDQSDLAQLSGAR